MGQFNCKDFPDIKNDLEQALEIKTNLYLEMNRSLFFDSSKDNIVKNLSYLVQPVLECVLGGGMAAWILSFSSANIISAFIFQSHLATCYLSATDTTYPHP